MLAQHFITASPYVSVLAHGLGKDDDNWPGCWYQSGPEKAAFSVIRLSWGTMESSIRHIVTHVDRWKINAWFGRLQGKNVAFLIRWICSSLLDPGCRFPADLPHVISHRAADQSNKREPTRFNLRIKLPFLHPPMLLTSSCLGEEDYQLPNDAVGDRGRSDLQLEAAAGWAGCGALLTSAL